MIGPATMIGPVMMIGRSLMLEVWRALGRGGDGRTQAPQIIIIVYNHNLGCVDYYSCISLVRLKGFVRFIKNKFACSTDFKRCVYSAVAQLSGVYCYFRVQDPATKVYCFLKIKFLQGVPFYHSNDIRLCPRLATNLATTVYCYPNIQVRLVAPLS